jgi:hypothetical protein
MQRRSNRKLTIVSICTDRPGGETKFSETELVSEGACSVLNYTAFAADVSSIGAETPLDRKIQA